MFAYILRATDSPPNEQTDEFFRRFCETPGLVHAYQLGGIDDPNEGIVVALWEDREAAERYLDSAPLRQEVDNAIPTVTRTMYEVRSHK